MRARVTTNSGLPRRLAALGLALWIGGFGCLFGCETMVSAAGTHEPRASAAKESIQAMHHGCCHAAKKKSGVAGTDAASNRSVRASAFTDSAVSQCPFSNPALDPARKMRVEDAHAIATVSPRASASTVRTFAFDPPLKPLAPDRGGTYLRCCVFLI